MPKHTHLAITRTDDGTNRVLLNGIDITNDLASLTVTALPHATTVTLNIAPTYLDLDLDMDGVTVDERHAADTDTED